MSLAQRAVQVTARVQVTVHASTYPEQKAVLQAARLGPGAHTGTVAGIEVRSVMRDVVGPDMGDSDADIYQQSRDSRWFLSKQISYRKYSNSRVVRLFLRPLGTERRYE
ncbi:hypothetical protein BA896_001350 [Janthinobacterium lividum]|uniref:Uncharacterized protein n=1 Tax=Janthinobacterium lividum TaxID=29581 RepID=A0A1E8PP97_9BURK|nr:hypothetical protein BA896_001350 [Janthinobacterium lividum]